MFGKREPERTELAPELKALEQQLAALTLAPPRIDRDKLMFEAGRASAQPAGPGYVAEPSRVGTRFWPAATYTMTAASLLFATMLVWQQHSQVVGPEIVAVPVNEHAPETVQQPSVHFANSTSTWPESKPNSGYLGIRYVAVTRGINAIAPEYSSGGGSSSGLEGSAPATARGLRDELLPRSKQTTFPRS